MTGVFWWYLLRNWNWIGYMIKMEKLNLLMIPIEELKRRAWCGCSDKHIAFDDTYWGIETQSIIDDYNSTCTNFWWYLLRNWNSVPWGQVWYPSAFWWYLLRNWNSYRCLIHLIPQSFWWYLLRNWNRLLPDRRYAFPSFDDTYWGIETQIARDVTVTAIAFDDTYWGIETGNARQAWQPHGIFWWYLLRNWNFSAQFFFYKFCPFDDTYWGIETRMANWCMNIIGSFDDTCCGQAFL